MLPVGLEWKTPGASIFSALLGECSGFDKIQSTPIKFRYNSSELDLAGAEIAIARHDDYLHKLKNALDSVISSNRYDIILLDCPHVIGYFVHECLKCCKRSNYTNAVRISSS